MEDFGELFGAIGEFFGGVTEAAAGGAAGLAAGAAIASYTGGGTFDETAVHDRCLAGGRRTLNVNDR